MNWKHIRTVWHKELLDTVRDRRTLIVMILVPLLIMPIFVLGPSYLMGAQEERKREEMQEIVVLNEIESSELGVLLRESKALQIVERPDPEAALREGEIAAILVIPADFAKKLAGEERASLLIKYDPTRVDSRIAREKLEALLDAYREQIVRLRLQQRGVPPDVLEPFALASESVATKERLGGFFLSFILPLFLVMWAAMGGSQTAIDTTAGEKERGTLEALLVTPPTRSSLVLGKFLAIWTVTIVATGISILGFVLSLQLGAKFMPVGGSAGMGLFLRDLSVSFKPVVAISLLAVAAMLAAMMSALSFALFTWTRNFKEAQTHMSWIIFFIMLPPIVVQFAEIKPALHSLAIPIFNATVVFKELLLGELNIAHLTITLISSALYAFLALRLAVRVFKNEKVLFRQ